MVKTFAESGLEIRVYTNKRGFSSCAGSGFVTGSTLSVAGFTSYRTCTAKLVGCDSIFYIRNGKILEVKPVGRCYSNESTRPEKGYERFVNP